MLARGFRRGLAVATALIAFAVPALALASIGWPVDLSVVGGQYTNDTTPTFTWKSAGGAAWYDYKLDNGTYVGIGNVNSYTVGTQSEGWHTFYLRGHNNAGETSEVRSVTFEIDTAGPVVPTVSPSTATEDASVTLTVTPSGEAAVDTCSLYVGGSNVGVMTKSGSTFSKNYTFTNDGSYTVYAVCTDTDGNTTTGSSRTVTVSEQDEDDEPVDDENDDEADNDEAEQGDLIKLECTGNVEVNDPCTAVYYWGFDDERHAFPNESVYYTWYSDFDDVVEVSADFLADIPLGETITYKPGTVVVKFDSSAYVYAIEEGGVLRHYLTPSLVAADYGSDWATEDLVMSSDAFFSDYFIGDDIDNSADYDPEDVEDGVTSIDDNF